MMVARMLYKKFGSKIKASKETQRERMRVRGQRLKAKQKTIES